METSELGDGGTEFKALRKDGNNNKKYTSLFGDSETQLWLQSPQAAETEKGKRAHAFAFQILLTRDVTFICNTNTLQKNSLVVQWLGPPAFTAEGRGSIPGRETAKKKKSVTHRTLIQGKKK